MMDPQTNIVEQQVTAVAILACQDEGSEAYPDEVVQLAELVIAQIKWRESGGFDPFADPDAPKADPQANALLRVCKQYKVTRVIATEPAAASLPEGYVLVIENLDGRNGFECGIAPDGRVSS